MSAKLVRRGGSRGYGWTSDRYRCTVCGRSGYGWNDKPGPWFEACARGHSPCEWCGRMLPVLKNGSARVHSRCPERPDDAELLRAVAANVRQDARLSVLGPMRKPGREILRRMVAP